MFFRTTSSALALIALATPALADVTPAEVWQNWVDYYKANGYTVTEGSRDEAGETLSLKDVVVSMEAPDQDGSAKFTVPELTLTATGDGKVRTTMSETSPFTLDFKDSEDEAVGLTGTVTMKDAEIVTSGSAGDMTHESKAAETGIVFTEVTTSDGTKPLPFTLRALNVTSTQRVVDGDLIKADGDLTAERLEFDGSFEDNSEEGMGGRIAVKGGMDDIKVSGGAAMPKGVDIANDMNAALKAGMDISGTLSAGSGSFTFDFAGEDPETGAKTASGKSDIQGFELTAAMSAAGLKYQGSSDKTTAEVTSSDMPFPISYGVESGTFDMQMPIMKSDKAEPFKFAYSIGGLTVGDAIWDLFDAEKKLSRDPASLDVDVTGLMRVAMDLFDPANMDAMEDGADEAAADDATGTDTAEADAEKTLEELTAEADAAMAELEEATEETPSPFEPTEITVNKLFFEGVGAKLDASGNLTVPEGGSIDAPVGKLSARLEGINGLIDNLVAIGVVPEDQVAGARMMLAMFAKPAPEGGDALVSEFEFKEGGQVFANGQQVK